MSEESESAKALLIDAAADLLDISRTRLPGIFVDAV